MNQATTTLLGAVAGLTIFFGLPVARLRPLNPRLQGLLTAIATGILIFLLVDIISHAADPVRQSLQAAHHGDPGTFAGLALIFMAGLGAGLVGLTCFTRWIGRVVRKRELRGPGAAAAAHLASAPSARALGLMIATGLGLHNLSEGLAIGQSAAAGALAFTGVLVMGFGLHNITEGFGVAAPMVAADDRPSWRFLAVTGLIGGGPTFLGTVIGYHVVSPAASVLFLALAAGALIYVIEEMFAVSRRLTHRVVLSSGVLLGFLAGFLTDLFLTYSGG